MKILMLVNWKVQYCKEPPCDKQPPDYYAEKEKYWFYRYFKEDCEVHVVDISSCSWLEKFEQYTLRFYILQFLKVVTKLGQYDLIVSHGMQSGVVLSLWRRLFPTKAKHIVYDIGSFNSAAESGFSLRLMQFASRSIDGIIYHTGSQKAYYQKCFPWIVSKSQFIRFGTDTDFFDTGELKEHEDKDRYMICVGYVKRDWDTLIQAYKTLHTDIKLRLVGHVEEKYKETEGVEQIPFVPIKELMDQIHNALFCILPLEAFLYSYGQMTLMQQMALGKCVLAARVPSLVDYAEDGNTAVLYEPKNAGDLADKMSLLLRDGDMRQRIGSNAAEYLRQSCNERIMAGQIEDYYNYIMGKESLR